MKRKDMFDAIVNAKINSISEGGSCEDYLREVIRYGLPVDALVDMTDERLRLEMADLNLTEEDLHD